MLPEARIKSRLSNRIRLKIDAKKGDAAYFQRIEQKLPESLPEGRVSASALTGSVVIHGTGLDLDAIGTAADRQGLFSLTAEKTGVLPLARRVALPIGGVNRQIHDLSGGALDLSGAIFLALLASGLWELAIGNFKRPPWYTAFWYAFGLFSKTIIDELRIDTE